MENKTPEYLELENRCRKYEQLIKNIYESCLCERFKTKGFDYHEKHQRLGEGAGRFFTPRELVENGIGFKWRYLKERGCCDSKKFLNLKTLEQNYGEYTHE